MRYMCLLRPHANSRYQASVMPLACAETCALLRRAGREAEVEVVRRAGIDWIEFECEALDERGLAEIRRSAHLYLIAEAHESGMMQPVASSEEAYLGEDLPYVLKYKGKTNETFTRFMINMALCAGSFPEDQPLRLLDPMCGRGTTLFEALNRGWHAAGMDVLGADVEEASRFFKKYLEFHRIKHAASKKSMTAKGKEAAVLQVYEFARDAAEFKAGNTRTLQLTCMNSERVCQLWSKPQFHLIAADLPYGVQHGPGGQRGKTLQQMVKDVLPAWKKVLLPGGAMALSFNTNTLRLEFVRQAMAEAGLRVMEGGEYDGLAHWVEQAITRDIAVAVRE